MVQGIAKLPNRVEMWVLVACIADAMLLEADLTGIHEHCLYYFGPRLFIH